jgi:arylsulfatase A-like enzyme
MLVGGAVAGYRAWRFRPRLGPALELPPEPLPGRLWHRRAGWTALVGALFAFLTAAGVLAGMFARSPGAGAVPVARNLVLVSLDTLRADRLGSYGYARDTSPKLDAFARDAFVFERAISAGNSTAGAHHALFQSRAASQAIRGAQAPTLAEILRQHGFRTVAFTDGGTMSRALGFARGFEHFDDGNRGLAESLPKAAYWLDRLAPRGERMYLFVHTFDVHLPYDPPPPYDTRFFPDYRGNVRGDTTLPLLRGLRALSRPGGAAPDPIGDEDRRQVQALYDGEILKTDTLLSALLSHLEKAGLEGDTLVVVLSDHGEEFWDHGSVLHSHTLYEELLHVPLVIRVPGWRDRARRVPERISTLDVLPTLLELLGVPAPGSVSGRSLVPLMRGAALPQEPIVSEGYPYGRSLQSVSVDGFKLIREPATGESRLYDLAADPREQTDVSQARPEIRDRLATLLDGLLGARPLEGDDPLDRPEALPEETQRRLRELGYIE